MFNRAAHSIKAAVRAAQAEYKRGGLNPQDDSEEKPFWDSYVYRLYRYGQYEHFYNNTIYDPYVNEFAMFFRQDQNLYQFIRSIYNPVYRLVELYVGKMFPGRINYQNLRTGAIALETDDETALNAIRMVMEASNWQQKNSLFVRNTVKYGDGFIKGVAMRDTQQIGLEVIDPAKIKHMHTDTSGRVTYLEIEYEALEDPNDFDSDLYLYTEIHTLDYIETKKDGEPYAFYVDAMGTPISRWENIYGFIAMQHIPYMDGGHIFAENAFSRQIAKIHELNDSASLLNDGIRNVINTVWGFPGTQPGDVAIDKTNRDKLGILNLPATTQTGQPFPLAYPLDITGGLENVRNQQMELEADLPELSLARIRHQSTNITAPGVLASYGDAIDRLMLARGVLSSGLVEAFRMALAMGAIHGYPGFETFSRETYTRRELELSIRDRPMVNDYLTKDQKIQHLIGTGASKQLVLEQMEIGQTEIEREAELDAEKREQESAEISRLLNSDDEDDEPADDEADGETNDETETES